MGFVVNAIYAMAHGLHRMREALCPPDTVGLCPEMQPVKGDVFLQHLYNVSFEGISGKNVSFDDNGDPSGRYVCKDKAFKYKLLGGARRVIAIDSVKTVIIWYQR